MKIYFIINFKKKLIIMEKFKIINFIHKSNKSNSDIFQKLIRESLSS